MQHRLLLLVLAVSIVGLTGCSLFGGSNGSSREAPEASFVTSADTYPVNVDPGRPFEVSARIPFTYTNTTQGPVFLPGCRPTPTPPSIERRTNGGRWEIAYAPVVRLCYSPPLELSPGETHEDTLDVTASFPGEDEAPTFESPFSGTFRLRIIATADSAATDTLSLDLRTSNPFELRQE